MELSTFTNATDSEKLETYTILINGRILRKGYLYTMTRNGIYGEIHTPLDEMITFLYSILSMIDCLPWKYLLKEYPNDLNRAIIETLMEHEKYNDFLDFHVITVN